MEIKPCRADILAVGKVVYGSLKVLEMVMAGFVDNGRAELGACLTELATLLWLRVAG